MRKSLSTEFERDASKFTSHLQGPRGASGSNENRGAQSRKHDVVMSTEDHRNGSETLNLDRKSAFLVYLKNAECSLRA